MYETVGIVANLGSLAVIGVIYLAYIKNLRSVVNLTDSQLKIAEQNVKLWKDRANELERKSPEFIEKQLSERIKIREDEIKRLSQDGEVHVEEIAHKNSEIEALKITLEKANQYRSTISVWDRDKSDFIEVSHNELEQIVVGSLCVDTASLMICDPYYSIQPSESERNECGAQKYMFQVVETGEIFCADDLDSNFELELLGLDAELTIEQMVNNGTLKRLDYSGELPAIPSTYIKGDTKHPRFKGITHLSFLNGRVGAGISIGLGADGIYPVIVESYKGEIQRIIIDL